MAAFIFASVLAPPSPARAQANGRHYQPDDAGVCVRASHPAVNGWLGRWYIGTREGRLQGETVVRAVTSGCGIWEQWHGVSGGNGRSLSALDVASGQWKYLFANDTGVVVTANGVPVSDTLRWTVTHLSVVGALDSATERWDWSAGRAVRHAGARSADGGTTWESLFDFTYYRWSDSLPPLSRHDGPCRSVQGYRSLDFVLGGWTITDGNGQPTGRAQFDSVIDACAIREQVSSGGSEVVGLFAYDAGGSLWRGVESSSHGSARALDGALSGSRGITFSTGDSASVRVRESVALLDDGRLRRRGERSVDGGRSWSPTVTRFYVRQPRR